MLSFQSQIAIHKFYIFALYGKEKKKKIEIKIDKLLGCYRLSSTSHFEAARDKINLPHKQTEKFDKKRLIKKKNFVNKCRLSSSNTNFEWCLYIKMKQKKKHSIGCRKYAKAKTQVGLSSKEDCGMCLVGVQGPRLTLKLKDLIDIVKPYFSTTTLDPIFQNDSKTSNGRSLASAIISGTSTG